MLLTLLLFAVINFSALGIGVLLMGNPRTNQWYQRVNKAPWTPPSWIFAAAWNTIMVCFTFFLWMATRELSWHALQIAYIMLAVQWVLNVIWNPVFFRWHQTALGLFLIIALEGVVTWFMVWGFINLGVVGILIIPYFVWLIIAASLNGYVLIKNRNNDPLVHTLEV